MQHETQPGTQGTLLPGWLYATLLISPFCFLTRLCQSLLLHSHIQRDPGGHLCFVLLLSFLDTCFQFILCVNSSCSTFLLCRCAVTPRCCTSFLDQRKIQKHNARIWVLRDFNKPPHVDILAYLIPQVSTLSCFCMFTNRFRSKFHNLFPSFHFKLFSVGDGVGTCALQNIKCLLIHFQFFFFTVPFPFLCIFLQSGSKFAPFHLLFIPPKDCPILHILLLASSCGGITSPTRPTWSWCGAMALAWHHHSGLKSWAWGKSWQHRLSKAS